MKKFLPHSSISHPPCFSGLGKILSLVSPFSMIMAGHNDLSFLGIGCECELKGEKCQMESLRFWDVHWSLDSARSLILFNSGCFRRLQAHFANLQDVAFRLVL